MQNITGHFINKILPLQQQHRERRHLSSTSFPVSANANHPFEFSTRRRTLSAHSKTKYQLKQARPLTPSSECVDITLLMPNDQNFFRLVGGWKRQLKAMLLQPNRVQKCVSVVERRCPVKTELRFQQKKQTDWWFLVGKKWPKVFFPAEVLLKDICHKGIVKHYLIVQSP